MTRLGKLLRTGFDTKNYYVSMNEALKKINGEYTMLHYPFFMNKADDFQQAQENLTDFCLDQLEQLEGKRIIEIGCGNGVQSLYLNERNKPGYVKGIDLNASNIAIARREVSMRKMEKVEFELGDAQNLKHIPDNSFDVLINIESAFHYPEKQSFLNEIERVLKPGGSFVIADILTTRKRRSGLKRYWTKRMGFHHWRKDEYAEGFTAAKLNLHTTKDISTDIIKGFRQYKHYLRMMKKGRFFEDRMLKLFYAFNSLLNIWLLKRRRLYLVYVGSKHG